MRLLTATALALMALVVANRVAAQDDEARAVVEMAVKAHGGLEKLDSVKAVSVKGKGVVSVMNMQIEFTQENNLQAPDRFRAEMQMQVNNMNFPVVVVFNGKKAWIKAADMLMELDEKGVEGMKDSMHAENISSLKFVKDKKYKMALIGEAKVKDAPAVGVRVSHDGKKDVSLYFDKKSNMLVKMDSRALDAQSGQEVAEERFFSEYKDVDGPKMPGRMVVHRDGQPYLDFHITEARIVERFDDSMFAKPE
ncbi:MAG: hypothetical protein L0Y72_02390 [Gemmataceae bacterium]|nr:hypothetical protein [Gemmataceae bacterium]